MTNAEVVGRLVNKPAPRLAYTSTPELALNDAFIGVEVEAEGVTGGARRPPDAVVAALAQYWQPHSDDSLRNGGAEFVYIAPLFGGDIVDSIKALCEVAAKNKFVISARTGLHVHLDVRALTVDELFVLLGTYALVEKAIYTWIGDKREFNHFCLPWYSAQGTLATTLSAFTKKDTGECLDILERAHRYSGLNLQSVMKFGSIEFRQMKTCFDYTRILSWINIILNLKRFAVDFVGNKGLDLLSLCDYAAHMGPRAFLEDVFKQKCPSLWYPAFTTDMYEYGLPSVEEVINGADLHNNTGLSFDRHMRLLSEERGQFPGLAVFKAKRQAEKAKKIQGTIELANLADVINPRAMADLGALNAAAEVTIRPTRRRVQDRVIVDDTWPTAEEAAAPQEEEDESDEDEDETPF